MHSNKSKNNRSLDRMVVNHIPNCSEEEFDDLLSAFGTDSINQISLIGWRESGLTTFVMRKMDKKFLSTKMPFQWLYLSACLIMAVSIISISKTPITQVQTRVTTNETLNNSCNGQVVPNLDSAENTIYLTEKSTTHNKQLLVDTDSICATDKTDRLENTIIFKNSLDLLPKPHYHEDGKLVGLHLAKEYYLYDLKLIDYTFYRTAKYQAPIYSLLTGTDASGKSRQSLFDYDEPELFNYAQTINDALFDFSEKKYNSAVTQFDIILNHIPTDVNALFYIGMSYFYLSDYPMASRYLKQVQQSGCNNFYEETNYYLGVSLIHLNRKDEGIKILETIIQRKGFYTIESERLLQSLKK